MIRDAHINNIQLGFLGSCYLKRTLRIISIYYYLSMTVQ